MSVSQPLPRVFSGIQPSGELHVGNWLGAVRTWAEQVAAQKEDLMFCVVDAHAITVEYDPADLRSRTLTMARDLVACGVDPARCTLFVQSDVREHTELAWYLQGVTPLGDLQRMTQFKEKSDNEEFVSTALFTYPVLMSADILLYKATIVPVGDDQLQHLELARETARGAPASGRPPPPTRRLLRRATAARRERGVLFPAGRAGEARALGRVQRRWRRQRRRRKKTNRQRRAQGVKFTVK